MTTQLVDIEREQKLEILFIALQDNGMTNGTINPHFSYYERLIQAAQSDDHFLSVLTRAVVRDGGFTCAL
jgi:hypothetical protein